MPRSKPLISKWRKFAKMNGFGSESEDDDPPQDFIQAMEKLDGRPTKRPYKPRQKKPPKPIQPRKQKK